MIEKVIDKIFVILLVVILLVLSLLLGQNKREGYVIVATSDTEAQSSVSAAVNKLLSNNSIGSTKAAMATAALDPFLKFQWAYDNQGQVQKVDLESRRLYCKPGVKDQDLGVKGVPMQSLKKIRGGTR